MYKGKISFTLRCCPRCQKTIWWLQKYYPIYIEWKAEEPWPQTVSRRWEVCDKCFEEYSKYYKDKYAIYWSNNATKV